MAGDIVAQSAYLPAFSRRQRKDVLSELVNQESLLPDPGTEPAP